MCCVWLVVGVGCAIACGRAGSSDEPVRGLKYQTSPLASASTSVERANPIHTSASSLVRSAQGVLHDLALVADP